MARIFISHSSRDNFEALAFRSWLESEGWAADDVFLDLHGIGAGARWKEALAKANARCEAVLFLVSPHSLASNECYVEIRMAEDMGKVILPTILPPRVPEDALAIDDPRLTIHRERQIVDASIEPREAAFTVEHEGQRRTVAFHAPTLARIKARLNHLGISPDSFAWVPGNLDTATPYPGLAGFSEGEAALFFGRTGDIARGFASLRKLRRTVLNSGQGALMVIQAASGAGKSSFLKAGLWPRLIRDPDFTPIGILRPATGILTGDNGVGRQFAAFFAQHNRLRPANEMHRALRTDGLEAQVALTALITEAAEIGRETQRLANRDAPPPTPVIAVDQAEELFAADDAAESGRFLSLVAYLVGKGAASSPVLLSPPLFIWTIQADSIGTLLLETSAHGLGAPDLFPLPPIPRTSFAEIINGPLAVANRAGMRVTMDPLLIQKLIDASEGADALPLLAYTLRQLVEDNRTGPRAHISLDAFESAGGIEGVLRKRLTAAKQAAGADDAQLRALFVPHLATWDADANPPGVKRLVADEAELLDGGRAALRPLADALVAERLLSRTGDVGQSGRTTLEVAHEALLRQPPIADWLEDAREFLVWRDAVGRARRGFEANARPHLMGRELEIARHWLERDIDPNIAPQDRAFIEASLGVEKRARNEEVERERQHQRAELKVARAQEQAAKDRELAIRRVARRTMVSMIVVLLLASGAALAGWYAWQQQQRAEAQSELAVAQARVARVAEQRARDEADNARAAEKRADSERDATLITQSRFLSDLAIQHLSGGRVDAGTAMLLALAGLRDTTRGLDGAALSERPYVPESEHALYTSVLQRRELAVLAGHTASVLSASFSPNGTRIVTASKDQTARLWDAVAGRPLASLDGHTNWVLSAAFSADGARIVTASEDSTARLWDAATGKPLATLGGHTGPVSAAAFSLDGARVVTASQDETARLWDAATGKPLATLEGHTGPVSAATFSSDGARVVTASQDGTARLWDAATGKPLVTLEGHTGPVSAAAFSPGGDRLITTSFDRTARLWEVATGKPLATLQGHSGPVWSADFSQDGARVVTASEDRTARLWDAGTGTLLATLMGHTGSVLSVAFSPVGAHILTGSQDRTARLWDAADGKPLATLEGHTSWILGAAFSRDGARLLTASADRTARLWNTAEGRPVATLEGHTDWILSAAFSQDGVHIVTASEDRTARLWQAATGKQLATLNGHTGWVLSAVFSLDGARLATASEDKTARLWEPATGKLLASLEGHTEPVMGAVFSPGGDRLVTISGDGTARLWDSATGKLFATLVGHRRPISSATFSPRGARLVTASGDGTARLWEVATGKLLATLEGHSAWVLNAAFSPNGAHLVTTSLDRTVRLWDATTGKPLATLVGDTGPISSAAFSADGARIVTASEDSTARLWDAATGKLLATYAGHTGPVLSATFSLDGMRVVTASRDRTARLWDAASGKQLAVLLGHTKAVRSAAFSADGARLVTASEDRTARLWHIPNGQALIDEAKWNVPRCLSQAQLKQFYLPLEPPRWCITGPGLEAERDSAKWQPKWPYHLLAWRDWLAARDRGEKPELP